MRKILLGCVLAMSLMAGGSALLPADVSAQQANKAFEACKLNPNASICRDRASNVLPDRVRNVINILITIVGMVSVILVVVGGLRYVLSGGDSAAVNSAKNTILYAIIGLVVAILAYAIVNFVLGWFT